jgi:P-type Ca2+ transporter type 2C
MASLEPYQRSAEDVCRELEVDPKQGLSSTEAAQRLSRHGRNILERKKKISPWKIFFEQFKDFLILILLGAAIISLVLGLVEEGGSITEGLLILIIVFAIALVGFLNEYKAEKTIEALKALVALRAKVIRDGEVQEIDSTELVPGDIVVLEEGQKVPADIRLIDTITLQAVEGSLTGESQPVLKQIEVINEEVTVGDRKNMVFSSTNVASGKGSGVVTGTGSNTEIGKIATLVEEAEDEQTPLQRKLDRLGRQMGYGVMAICVAVFVIIFFLDKEALASPLSRRLIMAFIAAVALAVAAIPEGLAFVVRVSLALGARRMAKRNALVRKLPAVEALGSTDTICSDKTGTLTKGEMTVRSVWADGQGYQFSGSGYSATGEITHDGRAIVNLAALEPVLKVGLLCNNSHIKDGKVIGDPTEAALLVAAQKAKLDDFSAERVGEIPFTSDRKQMSTIHQDQDGYYVASKGAVEMILKSCTQTLHGGRPVPLTDEMREEILDQNRKMSQEALRVLAFAYKETKEQPTEKSAENGLIFAGLQGMMDPPRLEIKETIEAVTGRAGIKVIMITGDHVETAKAVGREIGIVGEALTGAELDKLSQEGFEKQVEHISIYARVSPEHKIRIVQALKKHGHQVAMTGDGVNDAPAIKAADIGIAMGITGTDVAKEAADVVLLDDHFVTIVNAVEEGRGIFDNVRKFVNYLVSSNIAEVITVTLGIIMFGELALTAVQLLFINIVTDGLPAVALGSDPAEDGIMDHPPGRFQQEIINVRLWIEMFAFGIVMTAVLLYRFAGLLEHEGIRHAVALAFTGMVVMEMVRLIGLRSDYHIGWLSNPWLLVALASSFALQLIVLYTPLADIFQAKGLNGDDWIYLLIGALVVFIVMKLVRGVLLKVFPEDRPRRFDTA